MKMRAYTILFSLVLVMACKQVYEPPAIKAPNRYLVVEGVINANPGAVTRILLSRTRNLQDTVVSDPERSANMRIESSGGTRFNLFEVSPGVYETPQTTLNISETYRLVINTATGGEYASDYVPVKVTPPIDSLTWKQNLDAGTPKDVTVYANTHDAGNNTRYYRWDFVETWQYRSVFETDMLVNYNAGLIYYTDANTQVYNCWSVTPSTLIVLGSSAKLAQDVIDRAPLTVIPQHSPKLGVRYSILVKQYALTPEAYKFMEILQKNTQQLGTLFDPQPSQLKGNIKRISDATEPVIGYISASTVEEKRLFIANQQVTDWQGGLSSIDCTIQFIGQDPVNYLKWTISDTTYGPYYFVTRGIAIAKNGCLDCRRKGGSNQKPSFW